MRLRSITLNDIRRFTAPVAISGIGPGLNVLCAPNENGKSTLFDALQAVFFTPHRSKGKEIKALKPHAGGAPEVTVEIDTPEGRFRIFKRWSSRETAEVWQGDRLLAKADEAEAWIARLTHGSGDGGPAGLLWVRQGLTRFDHDRAKDLDATKSTRRDLMTSVTGEVETLTGGRRMDLALARARADLAVLLTASGKSRADGPLGKLEQEIASLTARHALLDGISRRLTDALARRAQIRRALADLQEPSAVQDRQRRLSESTTAFDAAERHAEAVETSDREVSMARLQVNEAAGRQAALIQSRDHAAGAAKADAVARQAAEDAKGKLADAEREVKDRLATFAAVRARRAAADARFRAALRADAARAAQTKRADLQDRLATLTKLTAALAAARKAAALGPDAKAIKALGEQMQQVTLLRSLQSQTATQVTMEYSGPLRLTLAGVDLAEGQPTPILTRAEIALPGIGTLTIQPGEGNDTTARLLKAEAEFASLLAATECPTLADAQAAAAAREEAAARVRDLTAHLAILAPKGVAAVEADLAQLPDPVADDPALPSTKTAQADLDLATQDLTAADQAHDAARTRAEHDRLAEARAQAAAQTAAATLAQAEAALASFGDLATAETTIAAALATARQALNRAADRHAALVAAAPDLAQAEAALARARSVASGAEAEIYALSKDLAGLDTMIDIHSGEGVAEDLADVSLRLAAAQAQRDRLLFEVAVLKELIATLESARDTARERYFEPIMAELKPLLRLLWPGAELKFDGESLLPVALIRDGQEEEIGILSGGTQEQIALFVRLAFARLLAKSGRHAPIILDDALVFTDDDRIERVFDALHGQAGDLQIIVLSCRQRAFRNLGGQKLDFLPLA
jgi:hypothetical protein